MQPTLYFLYNTSISGVAYTGIGGDQGNWKVMHLNTVSGVSPDKYVFTGGGINPFLPTPTAAYGSREATLRPNNNTLIIPQTYIESQTDNIMYNVPQAGKNSNRYVFGVYVDGYIASDLYMEAWDDSNFATTYLPVLSGTKSYPRSMINAVSTTNGAPITTWSGATYSGTEQSNYLSGYSNRVRLKGADSIQDEALYYNIYVELPYDSQLFHNMPVICFRYLYV